MIAPQRVSVACPYCRTPVTAELYSIVDVTEDPAQTPLSVRPFERGFMPQLPADVPDRRR
ncbi:MAG: hypothetical protein HZY76_15910 [Anaerolineae bacterium]|nr:MAG: hypothetical protein HZY76_15910 [Anaerolineae bacterium]